MEVFHGIGGDKLGEILLYEGGFQTAFEVLDHLLFRRQVVYGHNEIGAELYNQYFAVAVSIGRMYIITGDADNISLADAENGFVYPLGGFSLKDIKYFNFVMPMGMNKDMFFEIADPGHYRKQAVRHFYIFAVRFHFILLTG